jgi:hypothetical protein
MINRNEFISILKKDKELLAILISSIVSGVVLTICVIMASILFI